MTKLSVAVLSLLVALSACAGGGDAASPSPGGTATPATSPADAPPVAAGTTTVTVYYLTEHGGRVWLAPERRRLARTPAIGRAALQELLGGKAQDPDHYSPFPAGARILGVSIADRLATVDWNAAVLETSTPARVERLGIQAIVWTLTEFPTVTRVRLTVEGKDRGRASNGRRIETWWGHRSLAGQPFTRAQASGTLAPITIWSPQEGERVRGRELRVTGDASTFEANVALRLRDGGGRVVANTFTTATEGAPGRGTFEATLRFTPPASAETWTLEAVDQSAEDGSDFFVATRRIRVG